MNSKLLNEYFSKDIHFESERIRLRRVEIQDALDMHEYASKSITSKYLLWSPHTTVSYTASIVYSLVENYATGKYRDLAIIYKENNKMIGTVGITSFDEINNVGEIGYVLSPDYWGKEIAKEAAEMIINFAFCELKINRLEAKFIVGNDNSRRVMDKCNMTFEGIHRQKLHTKGEYKDVGIYSILYNEYMTETRKNIYKEQNPKGIINKILNR